MPRLVQSQSEEDGPGAPEWMLTYSDCMTLLLTFFVMLITFSSFDDKIYRKLESAFAEGLSSVAPEPTRDNLAFQATPRIVHHMELELGSEQPTIRGKYKSNPSQSLDFMDFENQKVFLIPSDKVFWGRGVYMSASGRQLLSDIATLLEARSDRIVISEHALENDEGAPDIGLRRAWRVVELLTGQHGFDKGRLSLSSASTVDREIIAQSAPFAGRSSAVRVLEIVVLERSIYQ